MTTLPTALFGRYKSYKEDTSIFATWLQNAATACGYQPVTKRASSKKTIGTPTKVKNPVRELLAQAKAITQSPVQVVLPKKVYQAAERAIEARKDLNRHFQGLGVNDRMNKSHLFFIKLLIEAVEHVKSLLAIKPPSSRSTPLKTQHNETASNRFGPLEYDAIKDPSEQAEESSGEEALAVNDTNIIVEVLEDEDRAINDLIECTMSIIMLLMTVRDIRTYVGSLWKQYKEGKLDLASCSMTTNTAVVLVRHESEALAEELGISIENCHTFFMDRLRILMDDEPGHSLEEVLVGQSPINVLTCTEIAVTMSQYIKTMGRKLRVESYVFLPCLRGRDTEDPVFDRVMYHQASLTRMMTDFGARYRSTPPGEAAKRRMIAMDEAMQAIGLTLTRRALSTTAVFAAAMLLDIDAFLGDDDEKLFRELGMFAASQQQAMHHTLTTSDIRSGPQWLAGDMELCHLYHQSLAEIAEIVRRSKTNVMMKNPVFRGMQMMNLQNTAEDLGVRLGNNHSSLIILAYLYNAMKQKQLIQRDWHALETIIAAHKDSLFFGSTPITPKDSALRLSLRLGLPLTAYLDLDPKFLKPLKPGQNMTRTKTGGNTGSNKKSKIDSDCLRKTKISEELEKYFTSNDTLLRIAHAVVAIGEKQAGYAASVKTTKKSSKNHNNAAQALGPVKFLTKLTKYLVDNQAISCIDHIYWTRKCHEMMEEILVVIKPRMETDLAGMLTSTDRLRLSNARDNVKASPTMHTARYLNVVNKILVEDQDRSEYPDAFPLLERMGMSEGWELGKASGIVNKFIAKVLAQEDQKVGESGKNI